MIQTGAVEEVDPRSSVEGFYSRLFLVPKKDGKHRPVINLRPLNAFLRHQHFKMEGIHVVRDLLQQGDWMARIDLKDAYFAVPVCPSDCKYLHFKWRSKSYEFTCLPFGLSTAPRVFTKVLRPVIAYLREKGIRCVIYLDDILIMNQDKESLREDVALVLTLLEALGFLVNYVKSSLSPVQVLVYLGFAVDSRTRELSQPPDKLHQITAEARHLVKLKEVSGRELAQICGKMSAAILAVYPAPLHYRGLQALKHKALRRGNYDNRITLSEDARQDLLWWINNLQEWNGRRTYREEHHLEIETDASLQGWGAFCHGEMTGGSWSQDEKLPTMFFHKGFECKEHCKQLQAIDQVRQCLNCSPLNSLGSEFSSQGHFHTLQLLNVPQFLFCRVVMLKTAPRGNFSHT